LIKAEKDEKEWKEENRGVLYRGCNFGDSLKYINRRRLGKALNPESEKNY
jgi:hypothetical protein